MNHPTAYTPLESLFLFQSLLTHGADTGAFVRISEILKNNALVKSDKSFDAARLAPDALQQLFLLLLREEAKNGTGSTTTTNATATTAGSSTTAADASASPAPRKRKLGSPPLPALREAYEHIERVPALVDRLYARYRDTIVKEIREDEEKFATVQKHIQCLEKNENERLAKAAASQNAASTLAPRDGRPNPGQSPTPAPGQAGVIKRPMSTTPVYPPRPPSTSTVQPSVAAPSHLQTGTTPVRPPQPSPKPPSTTASGLQAPAGMPQPGSRVPQPPGQPPKPALSPRPDAAAAAAALKPKEATPSAAGQAAATGTLKWEKPYQPPAPQTPQTLQTSGTAAQAQPTAPINATSGASREPQQQRTPQQQGQFAGPLPTPAVAAQGRPIPGKQVLVAPQTIGQLSTPVQPARPRPGGVPAVQSQPQQQQQQQQQHNPRPISTTPVIPPSRPFPPQPAQQTPRPIAAASPTPQKGVTVPTIAPQKWTPAQAAQQQRTRRPSPSASPGPLAQKDKGNTTPYNTQPPPPRPAIPEHIIRQAAAAQAAAAAATPNAKKISPVTAAPSTPGATTPMAALTRGFGTKWASHSTPSTPRPITAEPESPAYEPVSPPPRDTSILSDTPRSSSKRDLPKGGLKTGVARPRGRPPRSSHGGRGMSTTPSISGTRRSQSVASQADELAMDHPISSTRIKREILTPRHIEETGDTTADESVYGRTNMATPGSASSRLAKRKRQESPPHVPTAPPTQVLWTRGFTKVSSSALDQISSHRDANMFATGVRERDAPNYRQIVLQPQDITSVRAAIKQGNKAAIQAAGSLPGGDPGTASVLLPISEDLVPPKGIVNSAQLERELVHMFCNAIMYNPDPDRGPGPAFLKRSRDEEEEVVGYHLDENGVVKNTRSMFVEVEKLLGDLRSAEKDRGAPPPSATRPASVATPADDTAEDEDELAGDGITAASAVKRRRTTTRN
ncbi:Bromodomain protein [Metarhizium album ARSEF 1941]|uniref:Bromodomain protein n=1 Tax=Metarhizium album (strain ARSEF 1941) TaxID=1081103 RepID=A0A0B2WZP9_METAS|nr:Bromodomain protein [Metarhizium album ARSEF 1941]KHN98300.1 Bromodomain protein [Metarhizium album ARSEF 1941]